MQRSVSTKNANRPEGAASRRSPREVRRRCAGDRKVIEVVPSRTGQAPDLVPGKSTVGQRPRVRDQTSSGPRPRRSMTPGLKPSTNTSAAEHARRTSWRAVVVGDVAARTERASSPARVARCAREGHRSRRSDLDDLVTGERPEAAVIRDSLSSATAGTERIAVSVLVLISINSRHGPVAVRYQHPRPRHLRQRRSRDLRPAARPVRLPARARRRATGRPSTTRASSTGSGSSAATRTARRSTATTSSGPPTAARRTSGRSRRSATTSASRR